MLIDLHLKKQDNIVSTSFLKKWINNTIACFNDIKEYGVMFIC